MTVDTQPTEQLNPAHTWRPLRLFNFYRLLLSGFFVLLTFSDLSIRPIGEHNQTLFDGVAIIYLLLAAQYVSPPRSIARHSSILSPSPC